MHSAANVNKSEYTEIGDAGTMNEWSTNGMKMMKKEEKTTYRRTSKWMLSDDIACSIANRISLMFSGICTWTAGRVGRPTLIPSFPKKHICQRDLVN